MSRITTRQDRETFSEDKTGQGGGKDLKQGEGEGLFKAEAGRYSRYRQSVIQGRSEGQGFKVLTKYYSSY
jgi:hypothetical protein